MKITKLNLKHLLLLLCSFAFATNASAQTFHVGGVEWQHNSDSYAANGIYLQSAVTDGAIFTLPAPATIDDMHPDLQYCTKGYKIYKSGATSSAVTLETFSGGNMPAIYPVTRNNSSGDYFYMGPAVASDDAGTL